MNKIYRIIRYGEWDIGFEQWDGKHQFGYYEHYYDGWWCAFHLWRFYISVYHLHGPLFGDKE